jgi:hypothetical protein
MVNVDDAVGERDEQIGRPSTVANFRKQVGEFELAECLEIHPLRSGALESRPIFRNSLGKPLNMNNLVGRVILPALNRSELCRESENDTRTAVTSIT